MSHCVSLGVSLGGRMGGSLANGLVFQQLYFHSPTSSKVKIFAEGHCPTLSLCAVVFLIRFPPSSCHVSFLLRRPQATYKRWVKTGRQKEIHFLKNFILPPFTLLEEVMSLSETHFNFNFWFSGLSKQFMIYCKIP